jgi:hypothetical protein
MAFPFNLARISSAAQDQDPLAFFLSGLSDPVTAWGRAWTLIRSGCQLSGTDRNGLWLRHKTN